jgi:hypothetical protein
MTRKWLMAGALAAGVTVLAGAAYAASDDEGRWHRGPGYMRGEGSLGEGWRGRRYDDRDQDDWRRGDRRGREHGRDHDRDHGMGHGMHGHMGRDMREHGPMGRGMGRGMHEGRPGFGRMAAADPVQIDSLKKELGITAQQEEAWTKYAAVLKETADAVKARHEGIDRDAIRGMSAEDHRKFRDGMREQRQKEFDAVKSASDELLKSFDEKQKAIAREVLPGLAYGPGTRGAGMGRWHRH